MEINFDSIPAKYLNFSSRHLLGQFLNPEQNFFSKEGFARDYRGLAEQMDFQYNDIRNFQRHEDPTLKILEAWTLQPNSTIGKLISFLENMGRHDIIQDLRPRFENDSKVYLQKIELQQDCPLQVPEVTSCRPQSNHLDDLNVLSRDDVYTGECTLYDGYISYADEDIGFVYNLAGFLEAAGFKLFIRSRDLLAGHSEYETNMQLIKERCKRVLIILSPAFLKCPACEVQASFAAGLGFVERCRKIIPILWKPCEIPLILKFVSRIDFTKPDVQDWIWEKLISSLKDTPSAVFISSERRILQEQKKMPLPESSLPETSDPEITFPSTCSFAQNADTAVSSCLSSFDIHEESSLGMLKKYESGAQALPEKNNHLKLGDQSSNLVNIKQEELSNDSVLSAGKNVNPSKQKSKFRFWHTKKSPKKGDLYCNSSVVSASSNATSGFHSQSCNVLESISISNDDCSHDTPV